MRLVLGTVLVMALVATSLSLTGTSGAPAGPTFATVSVLAPAQSFPHDCAECPPPMTMGTSTSGSGSSTP
ncbi:MAG: hypothetical protein ACYDCK_06065 [Thermoplasmatota archaeon]